jgi:hypothetical protein
MSSTCAVRADCFTGARNLGRCETAVVMRRPVDTAIDGYSDACELSGSQTGRTDTTYGNWPLKHRGEYFSSAQFVVDRGLGLTD